MIKKTIGVAVTAALLGVTTLSFGQAGGTGSAGASTTVTTNAKDCVGLKGAERATCLREHRDATRDASGGGTRNPADNRYNTPASGTGASSSAGAGATPSAGPGNAANSTTPAGPGGADNRYSSPASGTSGTGTPR